MRFPTTPWTPAAYHGAGRRRRFFEGWYFKCVSADESRSLAVIPGVSRPSDPAGAHAFVMVAEAGDARPMVFRYPLAEFRAVPARFDLRIGPNRFSPRGFELDLADGMRTVKGRLSFSRLSPWPIRPLSPGAMGWYAFVPTMECFHAVLSFDHQLQGSVSIDGRACDLSGGKGYVEKDWGVSMPAAWIWLQSNHFEEDGVSVFGSIARIPWRRSSFTGFIFGFRRAGRVHRLATTTGARIRELGFDGDHVRIDVESGAGRLELAARRSDGIELPAPAFGDMTAKITESLRSRLETRFTAAGTGPVSGCEFSGTGRNAGLEFVGDIDELVKGLKKP